MENTATSAASTRIALLAIDSKDASQLWNIVDRFLGKDFAIGVSASADIAILDSDAHGFVETLHNWRADHPGAPVIALSASPTVDLPDLLHVRKPLNVVELIGIIGKLGNRIRDKRLAATGVVKVDICMSTDPLRVLDSIGIATDISGRIPYEKGMGAKAQHASAAP